MGSRSALFADAGFYQTVEKAFSSGCPKVLPSLTRKPDGCILGIPLRLPQNTNAKHDKLPPQAKQNTLLT
jgi:hypothetical protein